MRQIFRNLMKHWVYIIPIFALLIVQAYCDLALPQYTSKIIDVGIQDSGLEHILPEKIREEEYASVILFMTQQEQKLWEAAYKKKGDCYVRIVQDEAELEQLDADLLMPILVDYQMSSVEVTAFRDNLWNMEQVQEALAKAHIDEKRFKSMSVEEIGKLFQMDITSYFKSVEDENDNNKTVQKEYVDMRKLFSLMSGTDTGNTSSLETAREGFQSMLDSVGDSTLHSMGVKWAVEREAEAGVDVEKQQIQYLWSSGFKMLLLALLMALVSIIISLLASIVGARVGRDLREQVYEQVVSFSNAEIDKFSTASLITRNTNDVQQIQMVSIMLLRMVLYAPILGIGGVFKVIQTGAGMGWIIALAVVLIVGMVLLLVSITMPKFKMMQKLVDAVNLVSREILTGLSVIRAFGREKEEEKRFDKANTELKNTQLFTNRVMTFMMPGMMTIMYLINVLIIWVAAHKIDEGMLQVGTMTAFITYAMQIVMSFLMLTMMSIMLPRAGVAAERIEEVLSTKTSVLEAKERQAITNNQGILTFDHVNFRYPDAKEDVLYNISFTAEPGKTTAIIGSTGCGKSTLVNLIPRLYDVTEGSITLDGVDIRKLSLKDLREEIGFVPQKAVLFSGTIDTNLRFGNSDADESVLVKAAQIAQAEEFIKEKEDGYESSIAQGGSNVSGGQKQRLSIARAIAKQPKILVFDDSFSALDMKTDAKLRNALKQQVSDSTVIIVAQRISTILQADQILVLDDGELVGKGTHEELLKSCEVYEQIARSQLSEKELGLNQEVKAHE